MRIIGVSKVKAVDASAERILDDIAKHLFEVSYSAALLTRNKDKRVAVFAKDIERKSDAIRKMIENFN